MVKIIDEVKGGWKQLFATLLVTMEPKKSLENQIFDDSSLSCEDKEALIKSLKDIDELGDNLFNNERIQKNPNKLSKKKTSANYSKNNKEKNITIVNKEDIEKEIGD